MARAGGGLFGRAAEPAAATMDTMHAFESMTMNQVCDADVPHTLLLSRAVEPKRVNFLGLLLQMAFPNTAGRWTLATEVRRRFVRSMLTSSPPPPSLRGRTSGLVAAARRPPAAARTAARCQFPKSFRGCSRCPPRSSARC